MTVKDFLNKDGNLINLADVAKQMWPNNKGARAYLEKKLNGVRPWTVKDTEIAKNVLKKLTIDISGLD